MTGFNCKNCKKCKTTPEIKDNLESKKIVLAGNPNVGKSVIFTALTGIYAEVSNYPGTTVSITSAKTPCGEIIDTPGTYALGNYSEDEKVAKEIIIKADAVINIISALTLERDLFLTATLMDLGLPLLVIVNQIDEAKKNNIAIDFNELENALQAKVIPCVATQNQGIDDVFASIKTWSFQNSTPATEIAKNIPQDKKIERIIEIEASEGSDPNFDKIHTQRVNFIDKTVKSAVEYRKGADSLASVIENALFNPFFGTLTALLILYLLFLVVGIFISGNVVDFVYGTLEQKLFPIFQNFAQKYIPSEILTEVLFGEFGVFTMSLGIIIGVLIPLLTAFYVFTSILEDSGYLPRLAVFCDNALNKIGLNGKAVIPLILGFGCTTMGTLSARILGSNKERMIATALLGIAIPCAAQQGVILTLLASIGGFKVWAIYLLTIFVIMALVGSVLNQFCAEKTSGLLISLPPLRLPKIKNITAKTLSRMSCFLKEATPFFVASSIIISLLQHFGFLKIFENWLKPIIVNLLHLPAEFSNTFIMGLIRRDLASAGLFTIVGNGSAHKMDDLQIFVAAVVITLFVPCIAMLIMVFKERGVKEGIILWLSAFAISITTGAILTRTFAWMF